MATSKNKWITPETQSLFDTMATLKGSAEIRNFCRDLMTETEIIEFGNRWKAARMLTQKLPYVSIVQETGMSSTTVARVKKWLTQGMGGYRLALKRLEEKT
ncbi:MAG: YerC/YecD family TrpR-related protein [Patescibacteria group bacterium]